MKLRILSSVILASLAANTAFAETAMPATDIAAASATAAISASTAVTVSTPYNTATGSSWYSATAQNYAAPIVLPTFDTSEVVETEDDVEVRAEEKPSFPLFDGATPVNIGGQPFRIGTPKQFSRVDEYSEPGTFNVDGFGAAPRATNLIAKLKF